MELGRTFTAMANDQALFRRSLFVDGRPFVPDPDWQECDFLATDPAWAYATGRWPVRLPPPEKLCALLIRGRGHSKTSDLAIRGIEALLFSGQPVHGVAAAGDEKQASILLEAVAKLLRPPNDWIGALLEMQSKKVINRNTGSYLEILSSDALSSWGTFDPTFIILDEITHWKNPALFESLSSAQMKRPNCCLTIICNAGHKLHWAWDLRCKVINDPSWYVHELDGPRASWIDKKRLEQYRRMSITEGEYERVALNRWGEMSSEAVFRQEDIDAAFSDDIDPIIL